MSCCHGEISNKKIKAMKKVRPQILCRSLSTNVFTFILFLCLALSPALRAATVTWDASGANPTAPTDGSGIWGTAAADWSNGSTDNNWNNNDSAIIGVSNGTAGTVTIDATGVTVFEHHLQCNKLHYRQFGGLIDFDTEFDDYCSFRCEQFNHRQHCWKWLYQARCRQVDP